ncbi:MAG: cyclase family protein [Caulobacteraceae bacterium]|nr:cyclase family protein [Caulobacteraceae bacterium]
MPGAPMDAQDPMEEVRALGRRLSNWGRWGPQDEKGTLNLITPERIQAAAALVRRGEVFSLALPLDEHGPAPTGRFNPIHRMTRYRGEGPSGERFPHHSSSDDLAILALQSSTQWDALAHVWYDDKLYNGFPADTINAGGAHHCAISNWVRGIVGRGVLADVARRLSPPCLPEAYPITPADLEATLAAQGCDVGAGDILILRTGELGQWRKDRTRLGPRQAGLTLECAQWLHDREVAAVCADNTAVEVARQEGRALMAFHMVAIRDMGMALGELFVLDALAERCAELGCYEVFFCGAPLNFPRAVGTPLNPLAML